MKKLLSLCLAALALLPMGKLCANDAATMQMAGQLMGGLFQHAAEERKAQAEAEAKRKAEEAKRIAAENEALLRNSLELDLIDPDEGRHNLGIQIVPCRSAATIQCMSGQQDASGRLILASLSADLQGMPANLKLVNRDLPNSVNITVIRQSTGGSVDGTWIIKNVPFKYFYRDAKKLEYTIQLISEDEVALKITSYPKQSELVKVTLVKGIPFDYAVESGVDGKGLTNRTYTRGIGTDPQKPRKRKLSW